MVVTVEVVDEVVVVDSIEAVVVVDEVDLIETEVNKAEELWRIFFVRYQESL